jgi:hypothetical protein
MPIIIKDVVTHSNGGDGIKIGADRDVRVEGARSFNNKGHGISIQIPNTQFQIDPQDLEAAKEIAKNHPREEWVDRISKLTTIANFGNSAIAAATAIVKAFLP